MPRSFEDAARPALEGSLEPGEELRGIVAAIQQKTFRGNLFALGVTDRRLILQTVDRRFEPKDQPISIAYEDLESAEARHGRPWWSEAMIDVDSISLKITTGGAKLKLGMMPGGEGMLGALGGGEGQQRGIEALAQWMRERDAA